MDTLGGAPKEHVSSPYRQVDLLGGLTDADKPTVLEFAALVGFPSKGHLYRQGDRSSSIHLIKSGEVRTYYTGSNNSEFTIGIWSAGDLCGAPDIASGRRALSAIAQTAVEAYEFELDRLEQACLAVPPFGFQVIKALSFKVRWVSMIVGNVSTKDAKTRLCELLLALSSLIAEGEEDDFVVMRRVSLGQLALMIGASRQWTTRAMTELRERGAVEVLDGSRIRIHRLSLRDEAERAGAVPR
jgi:CRP/FNR family cyclic AMP-dependent transcriptional regulator